MGVAGSFPVATTACTGTSPNCVAGYITTDQNPPYTVKSGQVNLTTASTNPSIPYTCAVNTGNSSYATCTCSAPGGIGCFPGTYNASVVPAQTALYCDRSGVCSTTVPAASSKSLVYIGLGLAVALLFVIIIVIIYVRSRKKTEETVTEEATGESVAVETTQKEE